MVDGDAYIIDAVAVKGDGTYVEVDGELVRLSADDIIVLVYSETAGEEPPIEEDFESTYSPSPLKTPAK